ncbi:VOC family protein [Holophaga foetida]|uniref:VOC family protein n=1 Tax=Holophaga foetida TaxID=35839 RepID=UPI0002474694|nr:VOC family protein [Holophaga foetida]
MASPDAGIAGFHHVAIRVSDFDRSLAFYTTVLGFPLARTWGEGEGRGALLDAGSGNYLEVFAGGTPPLKPEAHWFHLALRSRDCAGLLERVRAAGAPVTVEPKDIVIPSAPPLPARIAFFTGPDGESIELFQEK